MSNPYLDDYLSMMMASEQTGQPNPMDVSQASPSHEVQGQMQPLAPLLEDPNLAAMKLPAPPPNPYEMGVSTDRGVGSETWADMLASMTPVEEEVAFSTPIGEQLPSYRPDEADQLAADQRERDYVGAYADLLPKR